MIDPASHPPTSVMIFEVLVPPAEVLDVARKRLDGLTDMADK